jgi:type II secretory pathway pseudopilin PulG
MSAAFQIPAIRASSWINMILDFEYIRRNKWTIYMKGNKGISIVEVIIYIAILGGLSVLIVNFLLQVTSVYHRARAEREVLSNARLLLETVNKSISPAREVYVPTSRFNTDLGQLSLSTALGAQTGHTASYIDFWIDNGRLWTRQEGGVNTALSAATVRVNKFKAERIVQGLGREAIKVTLEISSASKFPISTTLHMTTALRGNY